MPQLDFTSETPQADPGARKESYLQWRMRLADQQEGLRHYGEVDPEPAVSPEWSPEALFVTGCGSPAAAEADPLDVAPVVIDSVEPIAEVAPDAWDRSEVEALLVQFRATAGSPRAAARAARDARGPGLAAGQSLLEGGPDLVQSRDDRGDPYLDGSRVVRTSTPEQARNAASVGEQLRELNRLRVEGELDDDEFNRDKRALFARGSSSRRSSI